MDSIATTSSVARRRVAVWAGVAAASMLLAAPAPAESFYEGKNVELAIGANPGGGYDGYARTTARHVAKFIPGNPNIIPRNRPGAGSRKALKWMLKKAPKDGTVFGAVYPSALVDPLLRPKRSNYDARKLSLLGSVNKTSRLCIARKDSGIKTFKDVMEKELVLGATQRGGSTSDLPHMFNKLLGTKFKVIQGYKGSKGIMLAIERGEVQGICGYAWSSFKKARPDWAAGKFVNLLIQVTYERNPEMDAPQVWEFVKSDRDRKILEFMIKQHEFGRPYVAPPGVPKDRVAILREALTKTWNSKGFREDAKKARLDVNPITGEQLEKLITEIYETPKTIRTKYLAAIKKPS